MSLVPGISFYNLFNLANFGSLAGNLINADQAADNNTGPTGNPVAALNGSNTAAIENGVRTERGSGTFAQGSPRTTEFQLKLNF